METWSNLEEFWEFDATRSGWGTQVLEIIEETLPVSGLRFSWNVPFVQVRGKQGQPRSLLYLVYKSPAHFNQTYLVPHRNPTQEPELYLGFMNGAKLNDFGNLFERTNHKMVKYYWVNEIEALVRPQKVARNESSLHPGKKEPFQNLLEESYETLWGYPPGVTA